MKTFSIIIPVYNGRMVIGKALDSIYSQGLADEQFEVICVDDCSPTMETYDTLNNYTYNGKHPTNLKVLRHDENKRQGGARNTAFHHAEGMWILYLDQDDSFVESSLLKLLNSLNECTICDIVMFDYCLINTSRGKSITLHHIYANQGFSSSILQGTDFFLKYPIPYTPWCYAYKKAFLMQHQIQFEEKVRFEDVDYAIKSTLNAEYMTFIPIDVYQHIESGDNTSFVGNNRNLVEDLFKISIRIKKVSEDILPIQEKAGVAAMHHHIFHYHWLLSKILWRLSYCEIIDLLGRYIPYEKSNNRLIDFTLKHPRVYAALAQVARPFLLAAIWMRNKFK